MIVTWCIYFCNISEITLLIYWKLTHPWNVSCWERSCLLIYRCRERGGLPSHRSGIVQINDWLYWWDVKLLPMMSYVVVSSECPEFPFIYITSWLEKRISFSFTFHCRNMTLVGTPDRLMLHVWVMKNLWILYHSRSRRVTLCTIPHGYVIWGPILQKCTAVL